MDEMQRGGGQLFKNKKNKEGNSSRTGKVHKLEHISLLLTDTYTL